MMRNFRGALRSAAGNQRRVDALDAGGRQRTARTVQQGAP